MVDEKYSVTTVNGKPALAGALIFEDNFDSLDNSIWKHDRTMSGGGVNLTNSYILVR